jgi:LacI family transcriptional regulator
MQDAELIFNPKLQAQSTANLKGGEDAIQQLLDRGEKFTAVIAYNDLMAVGAMNRLQDVGIKVPDDVSVVGFDNLYISRSCRPQLSTMNYPIEEMATYAAELAIKLSADTAGAPPSQTHLFMSELIERKSVKAR